MRIFVATVFLVSLHHCPAAVAQETAIKKTASVIDEAVASRWNSSGVQPAKRSDDAEFCRRIWLDLAGMAPPVSSIRSFLANAKANKREMLVQELLQSPEHANHMAVMWTQILLPNQSESVPNRSSELTAWIRERFNQNEPYDYFVASFLTASGAEGVGPTAFYASNELEPKKLAAATSRIFLGIQLQCAECHDHPFDRWTQEDFWSYAAFFSQLSRDGSGNNQPMIIEDRPGPEVRLPGTDKVMAPRYPGIREAPEKDPGDIRRRQLTIWMASRDNPYLARAAVNRVWGQMMGRGFVDPVDAMDADNPVSHPELINQLTSFLVQQKFNLRSLYAAIALSQTYQLSSRYPPAQGRPAQDLFAVQSVKTLTPEQVYLTLQHNILRRTRNEDFSRQQFLARMDSGETSVLDYPHGVVQALAMMNGPETLLATSGKSGLLASLEAPFFDDASRIQTLYLATLSRPPSQAEVELCTKLLDKTSVAQRKNAWRDILWALINSSEFSVCP